MEGKNKKTRSAESDSRLEASDGRKRLQRRLVLPIGWSYATRRRRHRAVVKAAEWCCRWCPLAALFTLVATRFSSQFWWQAIWFTLTAVLILVLFGVPGAGLATASLIIRRENRWYRWFGILCYLLAAAGLIAVGCTGAWMLFKSAVLGH